VPASGSPASTAIRAALQPARRDFRVGEHLQRVEAADLRALPARVLQHRQLDRAAAVDDGLACAPIHFFADRAQRVVRDGDEDQL